MRGSVEAGAGERGGEAVLADELVEPVERLVVRDQDELADLVADRDRAAGAMASRPPVRASRLRTADGGHRRVAVDRQAGLAAQLGQPLERRDRGEQSSPSSPDRSTRRRRGTRPDAARGRRRRPARGPRGRSGSAAPRRARAARTSSGREASSDRSGSSTPLERAIRAARAHRGAARGGQYRRSRRRVAGSVIDRRGRARAARSRSRAARRAIWRSVISVARSPSTSTSAGRPWSL